MGIAKPWRSSGSSVEGGGVGVKSTAAGMLAFAVVGGVVGAGVPPSMVTLTSALLGPRQAAPARATGVENMSPRNPRRVRRIRRPSRPPWGRG